MKLNVHAKSKIPKHASRDEVQPVWSVIGATMLMFSDGPGRGGGCGGGYGGRGRGRGSGALATGRPRPYRSHVYLTRGLSVA